MALKELRTASRSWVAGIFVGLLVLSFAIWGVQDIFGGRQGRGVAKVGSEWIPTGDYQRRLQSELTQFAQQTGRRLSPEEAQTFGIADRVLQELISYKAIEVKGTRVGLASSDTTVVKEIRTTPAFQGLDGQFDAATYERVLRQYNFTPELYEDSLRGDIIRQQIVTAVTAGAFLPRGLAEALITHRTERRGIAYVTVTAKDIADPTQPDDETLKAFIAERPAQFSTAEARSFVALVLKPADFVGEVSVSDEEIQKQYDFDKAQYTVPEKRTVRTLAFPDATAATASLRRIQQGSTFEAEAKARGVNDADLAFNDVTHDDMFDAKVAEAVFDTAEPGLVGPIDGDLAWTIAEIKTVTPGNERPLAEVKDEIRLKLAESRAVDILYETMNTVEDSRAEGQSLEEIAKRLNLRLIAAEGVTSGGIAEASGAKPFDSVGAGGKEIVAAAFEAEEGLENDFQTTEDDLHYVVRLDSVALPAPKPFEAVRAEALQTYMEMERRKALQEKAQSLLAEAQTAGGIDKVARELGRSKTLSDTPLGRQSQHAVLPPSLIEDLFGAKIGELTISSAVNGEDWVLASVTEVLPPSTAEVAAGVTQVSGQLDQAMSADLVEQYVMGLRKELGVKVDQGVYSAAVAGMR